MSIFCFFISKEIKGTFFSVLRSKIPGNPLEQEQSLSNWLRCHRPTPPNTARRRGQAFLARGNTAGLAARCRQPYHGKGQPILLRSTEELECAETTYLKSTLESKFSLALQRPCVCGRAWGQSCSLRVVAAGTDVLTAWHLPLPTG